MSHTIWTTRDGQAILITKLEESHLHNIIAYLERVMAQVREEINSAWQFSSMLTGEYALLAVDSDIEFLEVQYEEFVRWLDIMRGERVRRAKMCPVA